jgi:hypothetical protein
LKSRKIVRFSLCIITSPSDSVMHNVHEWMNVCHHHTMVEEGDSTVQPQVYVMFVSLFWVSE